MYQLGYYYDNGYGVTQNFDAAYKWWMSAAKADHALAMYNTGIMYLKGKGTTPDPVQALYWLERASAKGLTEASGRLAIAYETGEGLPKSRGKAAYWWGITQDRVRAEQRRKQAEINAIVAEADRQRQQYQQQQQNNSGSNYNYPSQAAPSRTTWSIGGGQYMQYRESNHGRVLETKNNWWN